MTLTKIRLRFLDQSCECWYNNDKYLRRCVFAADVSHYGNTEAAPLIGQSLCVDHAMSFCGIVSNTHVDRKSIHKTFQDYLE